MWGTDRRRVLLALVCLAAAIVGVQLLDPFEQSAAETVERQPPQDRPAAVLNHSVAHLQTTSYTRTATVEADGQQREAFYAEMDYISGEYFYRIGFDDVSTRVYVHLDGAWVKTPERDWRHQGLAPIGGPTAGEAQARPYDPSYIHPDRTSIHNQTADTLWIRVDGNIQNTIAA